MLEAQSILTVGTVDKREGLAAINEALKIQIDICKFKLHKNPMNDKFIARIYEEKGVILKEISEECKDGEKQTLIRVKAMQAFNSGLAAMNQSGEVARIEPVEMLIAGLEKDEQAVQMIQTLGKFDTEFLVDPEEQNQLIKKQEAEESETNGDLMFAAGMIGLGVAIYYGYKYFKKH